MVFFSFFPNYMSFYDFEVKICSIFPNILLTQQCSQQLKLIFSREQTFKYRGKLNKPPEYKT